MSLKKLLCLFLVLYLIFSYSDLASAQFGQRIGQEVKKGLSKVGDTAKQVLSKFGEDVVYDIAGKITGAVVGGAIGAAVGGVVGLCTAGPAGVVVGATIYGFKGAGIGIMCSSILSQGIEDLVKKKIGTDKIPVKKGNQEKLKTLSKKIAITTKAISGIRERTRKSRISGRRPAWDRKDIGSFAHYRRMNQEHIKRQKKQIKSQITMQKAFPEVYRQALLRAFRSRDWDRFCSLVEEYYESGILPREIHGPAKRLISYYREARKTYSRDEINQGITQYMEKYAGKTYKALKERVK